MAAPTAPDVQDEPGISVARALPLAPELEAFFRRRGHGDDAPDLVQELFVLLLSKPGFRSHLPAPFRSFLFAIAYRLGANATRRRRHREGFGLEAAGAVRDDAPGPEKVALLAERSRRAADALEALPAETRRALLLVADEGKSIREAARELLVSEDVVRARLCRGRRRLAAILEERSPE